MATNPVLDFEILLTLSTAVMLSVVLSVREKGDGFFFRKGKSGDWKNELDKKIISQIEQAFKEEMKELNYL